MNDIRETEAREDMPMPPPDPNLGAAYYQLCATVLARLVDPTPAWYARLRQFDAGSVVADFVQLQKAPDFPTQDK